MLWKIYAWIYIALSTIGLLVLMTGISSWNLSSWEGAIESILLCIAVFSFTYKKQIFDKAVWKLIFIAILIIWIATIIFYTTDIQLLNFLRVNAIKFGITDVLLSVIVNIPALTAIYKLGFQKK